MRFVKRVLAILRILLYHLLAVTEKKSWQIYNTNPATFKTTCLCYSTYIPKASLNYLTQLYY